MMEIIKGLLIISGWLLIGAVVLRVADTKGLVLRHADTKSNFGCWCIGQHKAGAIYPPVAAIALMGWPVVGIMFLASFVLDWKPSSQSKDEPVPPRPTSAVDEEK